ncbi:M15 family metallopeptidase [Salirhabdus salicampi]|uniref:M15 family metallopeptidase n=1 Tax=Salirhabdus salicampi TaxID=476102 RepID=UPI0020C562F2|nr:M15 family metallopeptidase [Salirhabdus salicampi]MCP8615800.1 M15 family metallopeptidase [Salirhabdus salicampi]
MHRTIYVLLLFLFLLGCGDESKEYTKENHEKKANEQEEKEELDDENEEQKIEDEKPSGPTLESIFFNQIEVVDGQPTIVNPENRLALVNKEFALPNDYKPEDLVRPDVRFVFGDEDVEKSYLREEAATALEEMFQEANQNDIFLFAVSGYRSYKRQAALFQNQVDRVGEEQALLVVAQPGTSEHQTGLAIDISSESAGFGLTEEFGTTTEGKWLMENAHRFGFILRYPEGKENITNYIYEPWHYRYVGKEIATEVYENDWTLEEYFENVQEI